MLKKWTDLPEFMRTPEVKPYYDILKRKWFSLLIKRAFDFIVALVSLVVLALPMIVIAICIKLDSPGTVFYRQERVTMYGKHFRIHKFRTMVSDADKIGTAVTIGNDSRITRVGKKLRNLRLDELPQLLDVLSGDMSFVGTRPEVPKYVEQYDSEMKATLLLPAGLTSEASIRFKDEASMLTGEDDVDNIYITEILPVKMQWNLNSIIHFSFMQEMLTIFRTIAALLGKEYGEV